MFSRIHLFERFGNVPVYPKVAHAKHSQHEHLRWVIGVKGFHEPVCMGQVCTGGCQNTIGSTHKRRGFLEIPHQPSKNFRELCRREAEKRGSNIGVHELSCSTIMALF